MARTSLWWSGVWLCAAAVVAMPWHPAPRRLVETNRLDETYRLPGEAVPLHYDINLTPLLQPSFTFEGTVNILIEAKVNSPTLTLHADAGLKVQSCSLDGTSLANPTIDAERQFLVFALGGQSLVAGKQYSLTCIFMGTLSDDNRGFYRASYYDNEEDQIKWLAGTQFGPNFARRVFPCFDEPSLRATFSLTIQHNQDVSVVSNMRPSTVSRPGSNNLVTTKFEKTPVMPTYTLAWLVSYLPAVVSQDQGFSTYARPAALGKATLSQTVAPQVLQYMREYTGVPYVLDKLDQIAVPGFSGATENWGLISYREALVLADAQSRSTSNLAATTAVARQVAHQWFGNLVTPSWWSDVWLSEGFATLFSYLNADQVQPEWKVLGKMPVLEAHAAFVEDGVTSSLPLSYEDVSTPAEILARFGRTAAAKGASVLRMIRDKITPATFQKGVQYYLEDRKASGVANVNQLWSALNKAIVEDGTLGSSVDFNSLAASWTNQAGYPVVTFSRKASTANVEQARFYTTGTVASDSTIWHIPLSWRAEGDTSVRQVDSFASSSITINNVPAAAKWVLANVDQVGFYRVNYDRSNWEALSSALAQNVDALSEAERAMLVDDAFALARAGLVDYEVTLALCGFLASETAFAPWAAFQNNVDYLAVQLRAEDEDGAKVLDAWVQRLVHQRVEKLTFTSQPSESFEDKLSRGVVARLALEASDAAATSAATIAFNDWGLGTRLNADTARLSLCQGVRANNQLEPSAVFRELLERLKASADESEREDYIYALGCAPETEELRLKSEVLKVALEGEGLSQREQKALWKSLVSNLEGLRLVQRYAVDNSIAILQKYGLNKLVTMISTVAPRISLQSDYNELQAFATGGGAVITGLAETLNAALEVARQNLEWRSKYYRAVVDALREESTTTIGIPTDPAVRTTATTATPFTLPPTSAATQPTLPTLAPASSTADPGLPTDPATRTTATTPTSFTLPPTRATTEPTLPTLPPTSSTAYTGPPTDPATRTTATTATYFTLPQTSATTPATLPTLAPTSPGTGTTRTPGTSATGTTSAYTGVYTDPATRTTATKPTFWTLPPASPTTPVTLPPISDSPTTPSPRPTNPTNPTRTAAPTNPTRTVAPTNTPSTAAPTNRPSTAAPTNPSSTTMPTPSTTEKSGSASMRSSCGIIILLWLVSRFV